MSSDRQFPALRLTWPGGAQEFAAPTVSVGRVPGVDVRLDHPDISRRHAEFRRTPQGWYLIDLQSTNGTARDGRRVQHELLAPGSTSWLTFGGLNGVRVQAQVQPLPAAVPPPAAGRPPAVQPVPANRPSPPPAAVAVLPGHYADGHTVLPGHQAGGRVLTIGRSKSCDVVIDDPLVSRRHATMALGAQPVLRDLDSFNGTYVNGQRLHGEVTLSPGTEVVFGSQTFVWTGDNLAARAGRRDLTLHAENLTTVVKGGRRLLDGMSFDLAPSTLTAVIGPSGAGKSTLLGALTGSTPATHGRVVWQGTDLYTHYEQLRFQIGLVPQQDIQHPQLTVRQGLNYAAMLRLPPDTQASERAQRVRQVVGQMQLERQIDNRIGTQLSGGQKKRVSIATELLTAPPLLFLDEPTSGLDPGLDRDVMHQLRGLADEGRVVMVVTHSVLALDVCDNVLVLAPGGRRAYFGPPAGVLEHFRCRDYPEVFDMLDDADLWQRIPPPPKSAETGLLPAVNAPVAQPPVQSWSRQLGTLVRRNLAVTFSDKMLLAMLLLMPLILGALSRVVQGDDGLSVLRTATGDADTLSNAEATQRLTILIVAAALMGAAVTIRELVKERAIFQREYAVGLSPGIYLTSKVLVLGTACFLQGMAVTWIAMAGLPGPDDGGVLGMGSFEIAWAIGGITFAMAVLGLAVSAVVTSSEQTMPALVGLVMLQVVLCGALVPMGGRAFLEQLAWLAPARWGFAATAASVDLNAPARQVNERGGDAEVDGLYDSTAGQWFLNMTMLWILVGLLLAAAFWLVRRSAARR